MNNIIIICLRCVKASTKQQRRYWVDIELSAMGCLMASQCECVTVIGQGLESICQHQAITLYALVNHSNKTAIITEETCTQRLQIFHCVKPNKAEPSSMVRMLSTDEPPNKREEKKS